MNADTRKTIIEVVLIIIVVLLAALGGGWLSWYTALGSLAAACIAYLTIMCTKCQNKITKVHTDVMLKLNEIMGLQTYTPVRLEF